MTDLQLRPAGHAHDEGSRQTEGPSPEDLLVLAANERPATMSAISSLAEDTVFAAGIDASGKPGSLALFGSPLSGGVPELLYVDPDGMLMYAWRPVGGSDTSEHGDRGWRRDYVAREIREVKTVTHPNGTIYAFAVSAVDGTLKVFELGVTGEAWPDWREVTIPRWTYQNPIESIHVQYLDDAPRTPVVFVTLTLWAEMSIVTTIFGGWTNQVQPWAQRTNYLLSNSDAAELFAIGYDDASLSWLRYYTVNDAGDLWRTSHGAEGDKVQQLADTGWQSGIAGFAGPTGLGALGTDAQGNLLTFAPYDDNSVSGSGQTKKLPLGGEYTDLTRWQDGSGMLHLYGVSPGKQLHVLHQVGWDPFDPERACFAPTWDVVQGNDKNKTTFAAMRPLVGDVAAYAVDGYPDQMPNQVVQHAGGGSEATVIYTQQVGTSYWEQETIRVEAVPTAAPITQHRYQSRVLVQDGYGAPVAGCAVTVTSDAPVDLDIAGRGYRIRPNLPATVTTDLTGTLTLAVPAVGLATPALHLSVAGVGSSLTIQPAAEVHKFLAGAGTLPGHSGGLTAAALTAARTPDGKSPLFPVLAGPAPSESDGEWPPTAQQVVTWCQGAFAVGSGALLPVGLRDGLGEGEEVLAFSLQAHDPTRPATRVFTSKDDLARFRTERGVTEDSEWFGDLVEGLRASVLSAAEVIVDVVDSRLSVLVELANGAQVWLQARWDDVVSAAHAVEAILSALGAKIADVVAWLSWPFEFADVWASKEALKGEMANLVANLKQATTWMRGVPPDSWTAQARQAVDDSLASMGEVFGEQYISRFESGGPQPGIEIPLPSLGLDDFLRSSTCNWINDLMRRATYDNTTTFPDNPFSALINGIEALPEWEAFGPDLTKVVSDLAGLFDWWNPNSAKNILVTALLETLESLLKGGVELGAAALPLILDFMDDLTDRLVAWGQQPVGSPELQAVYSYIQQKAGVTGEPAILTFADMGVLMAAYPATVLYKVAFGDAPFKAGATGMADLQVPDTMPGALGGSQPPAKWKALRLFQGYFVIMMVLDGPFDVQMNNIAIAKSLQAPYWKPPKEYWVIWAYAHVLAYGIGDYPPFWGNEFPPEGWGPTDWGPTVMWFMSAVANAADLGCAAEWSTFLGVWEPDFDKKKGLLGPNLYFLLGGCRTIISGLRYMDGDDKDYPFAKWNCAINVTSFESATTGFLRMALLESSHRRSPDTFVWRGIVRAKSAVDFICDWFAGWASIVQIAYEDRCRPYISKVDYDDATVGKPWTAQLLGVDGMTPYSWSIVAPANPPQGTRPGLPASLSNWSPGALSGAEVALTGTPEKADVGTWIFLVRMEDDYGPGFAFQTDEVQTLVVQDAEG
ncbi:hypothetical protein ISU10_17885 [Nocardioides agariphilus]|uniref:Uncharacterized protein n=1 Tax=Nocardioides agariphilus TaxID=433664 RepID=A0A930VS31_9ACTN|nr:hypothetical protein [Nocardioides agariphilus]MBF4769642.1 hypothetical protein [Nocardioides agariphilus]